VRLPPIPIGPQVNTTMLPLMNNTKWEELRLEMYGLDELHPKWRTKTINSDYVSGWDGEWFYHFREAGYESIEWVEIRIESPEQHAAVFEVLKAVHVPGHQTENGFKIYGYSNGELALDYI
jgi:hypothetical protein